MIYLKQAVVVEGKYDKINVKNFLNTTIVTTDGFRVFKSESKKNLIKFLAKTVGVVVLTDSDLAGQLIRNHIKSFVKSGKVICAYVPKIYGVESRKQKHSKSGVLGVEAMSEDVVLAALQNSGVFLKCCRKTKRFTNLTLMEAGLLGLENSKINRKMFLKYLKLPEYLSTKQLLEVLNFNFSYAEFKNALLKYRERIS